MRRLRFVGSQDLSPSLRGFPLPSVGEEAGKCLCIDPTEVHAHRSEPLAPPDLLTRLGLTLDRGEDAAFVEHDVQVLPVPLGGEDLAGDAKGRPAVMVLFDRFG